MRSVSCPVRSVLLVVVFVSLGGAWAWASPTGLNNIPTTDVVPKDILVLQTWATWGSQHPDLFVGAKYGLLDGLEVGLDWKYNDEPHGHLALQAKYAFDLPGEHWRGVVGVANVSDDTGHQGDIFPYVATSYDLEVFRLHFGYTDQHHNEGFFAGIDKEVTVLNRGMVLRGDVIQVNDGDDLLYSAGFLYDLRPPEGEKREGFMGFWDTCTRNVLVETWVNMPTRGEASLTAKLNYVINF